MQNMIKKIKDKIKERFVGIVGSVSGITAFLGSWQVCHNICLGIVSLLAILGITVAGMPLLFLTKVAIPFWIAAVILLGITFWIYLKRRCISKNLILFNLGLIIAGVPFQPLQEYNLIFWSLGGALVLLSITFFVKGRLRKK